MTQKEYETFFDLLDKIVNAEGSWTSRKKKLIDEASDEDKINLQELTGWFE